MRGAADALEALVASWDTEVVVERRPTPQRADNDKAVNPVSLAALVLSIPSAVLAVADLADRIEKRRRAKQLIERAKIIRETTSVDVFIVLADGRRPLDGVDPDELLEAPHRLSHPTGVVTTASPAWPRGSRTAGPTWCWRSCTNTMTLSP